ncbi:baseplate J/gp47 family protein [Nocardia sp. bgisy118]|uniref:baseplate J/gp47 family protein n=1 Tax=Nocardia sp. bgisy118 TaxID=3413786 RepID=UPI003F4A4E90
MAEIRQVNGRPVIDYMARDYESLLRAMREQIPRLLPEWRSYTNEADVGNVLLELFAYLGDILSYYQDRVVNESFLATARSRRSVIQHLRLIGYELGTAAPAAAALDVTVPAAVTTTVTISKGDAFATKSRPGRPSARFEYTRDVPMTIDFGQLPAGASGHRTFPGVPVEEGRLIRDEILGSSDGSARQRFALVHPRVLLRPPGPTADGGGDVAVVTDLAGTEAVWTRRDSLAFSRTDNFDFVIEVDDEDRAFVVFGDDVLGAIPPAGARIVASYRVGGGQAGNVAAGAIQTLVSAPQLALLGATVSNPVSASGGAERESIEHAVEHAPAVFRSLRRAVTAGDYEALARNFKGVAKVRAVSAAWSVVTLYVAPDGRGKVSDVLEAELKGYFEDKRMLTQIVEIADVDYVPIYVTAEIGVQGFYVRADVVAAVQAAAAELLRFDRVDFGQTVYLSKFYEQSQDVPGVQFVNIVEFGRDRPGTAIDPQGTIELGPNELAITPPDADYAAGMRVVVIDRSGG